jgi:hypothetical protein
MALPFITSLEASSWDEWYTLGLIGHELKIFYIRDSIPIFEGLFALTELFASTLVPYGRTKPHRHHINLLYLLF